MSRKSKKVKKLSKCKAYLRNKISKNIHEFKKRSILKNGRRITSIKQALAISYSQTRKAFPRCKF